MIGHVYYRSRMCKSLDDVYVATCDKEIQVVNLMSPMKSKEEHEDPNEVKVVVDLSHFALYFSREPIPS